MSTTIHIKIEDVAELKNKILSWSKKYNTVAILDSNNYKKDKFSENEYIAGIGVLDEISIETNTNSFNKLAEFTKNNKSYIFGFLSYDLKNEIEDLISENTDNLYFPKLHFFVPQYILKINNNILSIISKNKNNIIKEIEEENIEIEEEILSNNFMSIFSKEKYIETVNNIKKNIQIGNIYELNFCQEFYTKPKKILPEKIFKNLIAISPTPFSSFYKFNNYYLIGASPERFIAKRDNKILSQPIKGTIKRSSNNKTDLKLKTQLSTDTKEISENVMIVDLVRNDISRIAKKGTVNVDELFGIYTFPQVHQMISTISAEIKENVSNIDILKNMFPMGSMTGAPKIRAMKLIEQYEQSMRGLFSGTVGYFSPNGNFDFNVVIRSLLYNLKEKYLSFQVGSAITINSDAEKEYNECIVKAKAILKVLNGTII